MGDGALPQSQSSKTPHNHRHVGAIDGHVGARPVLAVTGLRTEARIAAGPRILALSGCGDAAGLGQRIQAAAGKVSAIISFGVAGGLAKGIAPGTKLVARTIIAEDGARYMADPMWSNRLLAAGGASFADIAGMDLPVAGIAERHALHLKTGALAADTESHVAAKVAAAYGLPFAAFRVVADPAHRQLPHAALVAIRADGSLAFGAILGSLAKDPRQVPQLLRTANDARAAFYGLIRSRQLLGSRLGFCDFGEFLLDAPAEDVLGGPLAI